MAVFMDLKGTSQQTFQIQKGGARIKSEVVDSSPSLSIRLPDDTDYSSLKAYDIYLSGYQVSFMVDETGPDLYPLTLAMPGSGMTGVFQERCRLS